MSAYILGEFYISIQISKLHKVITSINIREYVFEAQISHYLAKYNSYVWKLICICRNFLSLLSFSSILKEFSGITWLNSALNSLSNGALILGAVMWRDIYARP